jgi:hypothetical protein
MKNNPGKEITRAWLIGAIQDAVLAEYGAREGSEWRRRRRIGRICLSARRM